MHIYKNKFMRIRTDNTYETDPKEPWLSWACSRSRRLVIWKTQGFRHAQVLGSCQLVSFDALPWLRVPKHRRFPCFFHRFLHIPLGIGGAGPTKPGGVRSAVSTWLRYDIRSTFFSHIKIKLVRACAIRLRGMATHSHALRATIRLSHLWFAAIKNLGPTSRLNRWAQIIALAMCRDLHFKSAGPAISAFCSQD